MERWKGKGAGDIPDFGTNKRSTRCPGNSRLFWWGNLEGLLHLIYVDFCDSLHQQPDVLNIHERNYERVLVLMTSVYKINEWGQGNVVSGYAAAPRFLLKVTVLAR